MRILIAENGMPEMGGFEVARRLKADKALQEIPILFTRTGIPLCSIPAGDVMANVSAKSGLGPNIGHLGVGSGFRY